jgi:hypothetical protein
MTGAEIARRTAASPTVRCIAGLLVLLACSWRMSLLPDAHAPAWMALTALAIAAGCVALGWLRPAHIALTAPQAMLLLGTLGMVAGLAWDARQGGFQTLVALCTAAPWSFFETLRMHWELLPAMHVGMVAGGLATVPILRVFRKACRRQFCARLTQNLACSVWMIAGMSGGTMLFAGAGHLFGARSAAAMLGGMFAGMVWGMVASVSLYRLWFMVMEREAPGRREAAAVHER